MVRLIEGQHACEASQWVTVCFGHAFSMKLSVFQRNGCISRIVLLQHFITHLYTNDNEKR